MPVNVMTDIVIDRPCADVAAYASDLSNVSDWYESVESVSWQTSPPLTVGSQLEIVVNVLGRRTTYAYEILDFVPSERLVMRTDNGPIQMETVYTWAPIDAGRTRMAIRNHGESSGFAKLGAPMMSAGLRRSSQRDLKTLKRILEQR
jgi:hypothetical protein